MVIVYCVDDDAFHLGKIQKVVEKACGLKGINDFEVIGCKDGYDFLAKVPQKKPKLITLDINMPNFDGLSTLVRYKVLNPSATILMVSSENEAVVQRLTSKHHTNVDPQKKQALLKSVIDRVKTGNKEPGKINSVLEAVSSLGLDPLSVAMKNGAREILQKPFDVDQASTIIARYLT